MQKWGRKTQGRAEIGKHLEPSYLSSVINVNSCFWDISFRWRNISKARISLLHLAVRIYFFITGQCLVYRSIIICIIRKIWDFQGSDYEKCRLLWYKILFHTSQETYYICATEPNRLNLCKIWGFHGGVYEEYRLLGYITQLIIHWRHMTSSLEIPGGWSYVAFEVLTAETMMSSREAFEELFKSHRA
jgi:hypothetical protein